MSTKWVQWRHDQLHFLRNSSKSPFTCWNTRFDMPSPPLVSTIPYDFHISSACENISSFYFIIVTGCRSFVKPHFISLCEHWLKYRRIMVWFCFVLNAKSNISTGFSWNDPRMKMFSHQKFSFEYSTRLCQALCPWTSMWVIARQGDVN